ncbi:MAG: hypothetical protein R6U98_06180, partial [Pirellulaceae bacterium]
LILALFGAWFFLRRFAPVEFWLVWSIPITVCLFQVTIRRQQRAAWPLLTVSVASVWYVWFALISAITDPGYTYTIIDIGWILSGMITPIVLYKLITSLRGNRIAVAVSAPLLISMTVGFLHFIVKFFVKVL